MDNKLFKAIQNKFENEIIEDLQYRQNYEMIDTTKSSKSIEYEMEKKIDLNDLDDETRQDIEDKYFSDFEGNEFNEWWTFNGDDYEAQYKQNNKDTNYDDIILYAYDEWLEQNGEKCWEEFNDLLNIVKHVVLTINNDYEDKIEFIADIYYEHDFVNDAKFNEKHESVFVYEFQLDKMCEILNNKFDLELSIPEDFISNYMDTYEAKIARIAKKIAK